MTKYGAIGNRYSTVEDGIKGTIIDARPEVHIMIYLARHPPSASLPPIPI